MTAQSGFPEHDPAAHRAFEALAARLRSATETGDARSLLDPAAIDEVDTLLGADPDEILQHPAWPIAIGTLHWIRFALLDAAGSGDAEAELDKAFLMFTALRTLVPDRIPAEFHSVYNAVDGDERARPDPRYLLSYARAMSGAEDDEERRDRVIVALRMVTDDRGSGSAGSRASALVELAQRLTNRFEAGGDRADLEEAIAACRRAIAVSGNEQPRTGFGLVLANALVLLFGQTGDMRLLDEAIEEYTAGLASLDPDDAAGVPIAANLSTALSARYQWRYDADDLDRAIALLERAAEITADGETKILIGLGNCYLIRYHRHRRPNDIDMGIGVMERAVAAAPAASTDLVFARFGLGNTLAARAESRAARSDDTTRAIDLLRAASDALPADSPHRAHMLSLLALVMRLRSTQVSGLDADAWLRSAESTSAAAATVLRASPAWRCRAFAEWAQAAAARGDWHAAAERFTSAVALLPAMVESGLQRSDQERQLANIRGAATEAAACAIRAGDAVGAIRLLEQGRGVLLAQELRTRKRDDGRPMSAAEFVTVAASGPIAVVNVSRFGCDALVITTGGVGAVPLPALTFEDLARRYLAFFDDIAELQRGGSSAETRVSELLGWLWDTVAAPIVDHLGLKAAPDGAIRPRLWLIPTGPLVFLPLHAAGHHGSAIPEGRSLMDRAVISYASTIRGLQHAAADPPARGRPRVPMVVAAPQVPDHPTLHRARAEAELVAARLGTTALVEDVTGDSVLAHLAAATWAHFACHASSLLLDPSASYLALPDGPLPVRRISELDNPDAEFAYLSACSTIRGGAEFTDEALNIAAAFQLAGFREVIATQWQVGDTAAWQMARLVYDNLPERGTGGVGAAIALHAAVRNLRDRYPGSPLIWAAYIHAGR